MKLSAFTTAAAIMASTAEAAHNIYVYSHSGCAGSALVCGNRTWNTCCSTMSQAFASTRVTGDWVNYRVFARECGTLPQSHEVGTGSCLSPTFAFHSVRTRYSEVPTNPPPNHPTPPPSWDRDDSAKRLKLKVRSEAEPEVDGSECEPDYVEFYDRKARSKVLAKIPKGKLAAVVKVLEKEPESGDAEGIKKALGWD